MHVWARKCAMLRCRTHGNTGICGPLVMRSICHACLVSHPNGASPFGGDRAPPLRGDGCSPCGGPPGHQRSAQGRAASVASAPSMNWDRLCVSERSFCIARAAHLRPLCRPSWFSRGWHLSAAAPCRILCPAVCLRSLVQAQTMGWTHCFAAVRHFCLFLAVRAHSSCHSSWFCHGWHLSVAARWCVLCPDLCLRHWPDI